MTPALRVAFWWGLGTILYLSFGLATTGWLFYELSHLLNSPAIYPLYSVFRGADYFLSLQELRLVISGAAGLIVGMLVYALVARKRKQK